MVRTLDQVIPVDYYLPGCPPTPTLLEQPLIGRCSRGRCPRREPCWRPTSPCATSARARRPSRTSSRSRTFQRPHEVIDRPRDVPAGPGTALHGPGDPRRLRGTLHQGNMPCTGCFGPTIRRQGPGGEDPLGIASSLNVEGHRGRRSTRRSPRSPIRSGHSTATACRSLLRCWAGRLTKITISEGHSMEIGAQHTNTGARRAADHHRSDHPPGRPREDRHLPRRQGEVERAYFQVPELRGFRGVQPRPARRGHAADHQPDLRRLPDGPPHGGDQGARRPVPGRAAARGEEDPRADLQHLHARGPRAALLHPRRPGLHRRARRAEGAAQCRGRDRQGRRGRRARRSSPCAGGCASSSPCSAAR